MKNNILCIILLTPSLLFAQAYKSTLELRNFKADCMAYELPFDEKETTEAYEIKLKRDGYKVRSKRGNITLKSTTINDIYSKPLDYVFNIARNPSDKTMSIVKIHISEIDRKLPLSYLGNEEMYKNAGTFIATFKEEVIKLNLENSISKIKDELKYADKEYQRSLDYKERYTKDRDRLNSKIEDTQKDIEREFKEVEILKAKLKSLENLRKN